MQVANSEFPFFFFFFSSSICLLPYSTILAVFMHCTHLIKNITTLDTSLLDHAITKVNVGIATAAFCRFSQWFTSIRPSTIALFFSFASSISMLTCIHTSIPSHALTRTYTEITHLPEPRIRTDKNEREREKKKLTPYVRF